MTIRGADAGRINSADLQRQLELEEPARRGGAFGGLSVRQVPPPDESPVQKAGPHPSMAASGPGASNPLSPDPASDPARNSAVQLQGDLVRLVNVLQQLQSTAKGNENPLAAGGSASPEGAKKGEGTSRAGLGDGAAGARRVEASNDPVKAKDAGETGAARNASGPADQISQIIFRVVEMRKQLISQLEEKPRNL